MTILCRLVAETLTESQGTEIRLRAIPQRGDHIYAANKLYRVKELAHWPLSNQNPDWPHVSILVDDLS